MNETINKLKIRVQDGILPAMATPLNADLTVNTAVIPSLANFLIDKGVNGLFVAGTTGEGILLDVAERMRLCETAVSAVNQRVPVIVHVGTFRTPDTLTLAKHAAQAGADAVAVIPPPFYPLSEETLRAYYHTIADAIPDIPLILYDIPQYAVNGISPSLLTQLGDELPSLAGVKSSRPDAQQVKVLLQVLPERAFMLTGNERIGLGLRALGTHGQITGLSTAIPEPFVALNQAIAQQNLPEAQKQQQLISLLLGMIPAGTRIGSIKQILTERSIDVGLPIPPRPTPTIPLWEKMATLL